MERFVDAHCHVLPEVDDGAQSMNETRQMLQMAYDEGIRYIIATPHHHPRRGKASPRQLRRQLKLVREEAEKISEILGKDLSVNKVGVRNVNERLKLNFGAGYGLRIQSEKGKGTEVILVMPSTAERGRGK